MARYLDENGLALLINNYLKPEDEYSLSSEHPVQNKVLTQTFGNLLSIIDYSKVTGYFHYANAAALPTVNSTGQEEGDFEYNPEKEMKVGQRAILDDTQAVMEISAIDSETGAITWINTGLSFGGQVIQVDELPTASAAEEDKIYQYVGDTDTLTGVTNGYFYKCVSDGAVSPSYSWENLKVSEGDTIQIETLPTAGASEVGNIYQYIGETNLSFTNGYFYECVEDSGSYNWVEKEVQKSDSTPHWSGTRAEYEAIKNTLEAGTVVSITDDYDEGLEVVDVIEEDNMNPVTSNAVAEITSHDLSTLTWNTTYISLGTWTTGGVLEKCGIVQFTKIFSVKAGIPSGTIICSGLPKPAMAAEIPVAWDGDSAIGGFFLNTNGDLASWATVTADTNCRINLVYIKAQ